MTSLRLFGSQLSVVLVLILALVPNRACEIQDEYPCRGIEVESEWVVRGGWKSPDNRLNFHVRLYPDVPPQVRAAIDAAVKGWNKYVDTSNIMLHLAPADAKVVATDLFIDRTENRDLHADCAEFHTGHLPKERKIASGPQVIYYSVPHYESWAKSPRNLDDAAVVMSHEIGHFFGLDEARDSLEATIMVQGNPPCESYARSSKTRLPTRDDAYHAGVCVSKHRSPSIPMKPSTVGRTGLTTGLIFSLLSLAYTPAITAQDPTTEKSSPDWGLARQSIQLAQMPIPDAAQYVKGEYVVELAPAEELVAKSLTSLTKDSGLVVVARLRKGESFLSKDRLSISTAFDADVSEVIKGPPGGPRPKTPWTIKIILPGGKIQLGTGQRAEVRIRNRKPVVKGETYVFFLQQVEQAWPASWINQVVKSGYVPQLGWQGIFQLTGRGVKPRGRDISPVPKKYANTPDKEFLEDVRVAAR